MSKSTFKVPENSSIPSLEEEVTTFWKKHNIFKKSVDCRSEDNLYVFYDGPPFISGLPHPGHLLGSIAKDIIPRYWTMKGKRVERVWGWDAHGLTVENKVQKKLGIKNRRDIEEYGLEKFTKECYKYTSETSAEWGWYIDKIGRWVDMANAYKTIDQTYMESVMWAFKQLYEKGFIYEGIRTSLYCTTCGTPVSNFEVAMDNTYKDVEDPSVIVKFKVTTDGKFNGMSILAWTTTPWTLPSNRGLVVDENEEYAIVSFEAEEFILAQKRVEAVFKDKSYKLHSLVKGKDLVGLAYRAPYNFYLPNENDFKVYSFKDMVTMEDGTGIVHSAPGFGEVDTDMGRAYGLTLMLTIDDEGKFIAGDGDENPLVGVYYKKANKIIREDLTSRGLMFDDSVIVHRFPYHDRCDTLLIQKAQNSWFVDVQKLKGRMLETNENINWVPEHLKEGRFKHVIDTSPDWSISRNRFWATPMPVWKSADGDVIVVGSIKEIEELTDQKVTDLHRPYIDEIVLKKDGKEYTRCEEVLDSWFEAGSMPYAQLHYPFENQEKFEKNFPGDYIVEYIAQVRAWFNVMHRLSVALFDTNSFTNVIATGVLAGNDGRKMSKTYGNFTDPKVILENIGGDALRLYMMNSPLMLGSNANFDDVEIKNKLNNVLNPLWNSLKFFVMYANQHGWSKENLVLSENVLDQWIITRLNQTIREFSENIEKYYVPSAVAPLESFADDLSRWYVRRSRERIASGENEALSTLYTVLMGFAKAAAPAIPFITENIYQHLISAEKSEEFPESVHLTMYPDFNKKILENDTTLLTNMQFTRDVVSLALSMRADKKLKVRQPLATLYVVSKKVGVTLYTDLVKDEVNVKDVIVVQDPPEATTSLVVSSNADLDVYLDVALSEELLIEGYAREFVRKVQDLRKLAALSVDQKVSVIFENTLENATAVAHHADYIKERVSAYELVSGSEFKIQS